MANSNKRTRKQDQEEAEINILDDKTVRKDIRHIDNLIGQASLNMYGTDRTSDVDSLTNAFHNIMNKELESLTNKNSGDITSFLGQIVSADNKNVAAEELLNNQFMSMTGDEYGTMQSFIYDAYRNRLLEQSDLHEVSSQLIELSEAILITRDAIVSSDVVEGRMSRSLKFDNIDEDDIDNNTAIIETMEKKFKLLEKIKNFVIPKTLEYGEYYVYIIPYSKLFNDFMNSKNKSGIGGKFYRESTVLEGFDESTREKGNKLDKKKNGEELKSFMESTYKEYIRTTDPKDKFKIEPTITKEDFESDLKNMMDNITISNDIVPLPVLEEGFSSIKEFRESFVSESGEYFATEANNGNKKSVNMFDKVSSTTAGAADGIFDEPGKTDKKSNFDDIKDCYVKMIEPTRMIPIKIMNTIIGYYYVQSEDITPLSGAVSSTLYYSKFDEHSKQTTVIDGISERVVKSFNKDFLNNNLKFKEAIVDCINYYNLNEKKLKFQFIPPEYVQEFKIDEDVDGNGQSMIKKSLFYAKLYLMLLLFKIMSIILNSNDTKVNYLKQSGIDKNVANKVQEIARIRQSRQVNITDLFSYTTLINKVGNGSELYIPTGRSGERPIETEILAGQDVQLNSDLLEMLKNAYILGTGVPAAIVNYLNEADFATVIVQNNTKFNGRVVNYQLDFNSSITEMYKKIMRWSTNISENMIENFSFILQAPRTTASTVKGEAIQSFTTVVDFLVTLLYDDPNNSMNPNLSEEIREFKKLFARDQLPMLDMDKIEEIIEEAKINSIKNKLEPDPSNGDNDDDGLEDEINNMPM